MQYTLEENKDSLLFIVKGALSFRDQDDFFKIIARVHTFKNGKVLLDLSECNFLDSAALGMITILGQEAAMGGSVLEINNPSPQAKELLNIAKMDEIFKINGDNDAG